MPFSSGGLALKRGAAALLCGALAIGSAAAQPGGDRYSAMVIDAGSGSILTAISADAPRYPASLTKMMTLYMTFEALRDRRITLDTPVPVSAHAASMVPTKLGLLSGARLTVEEAVLGMVTLSANDAASAMGELLGGDEERFGQLMTMRARALGMTRSVFRNASGLPDPDQVTTASDMAVLARHLIQDFPDQYHYFSTPKFAFRGRQIYNHDRMLVTYPGADGLKTGYIEAAGHNLVTSAVHGNVRLIGVVLGAASNAERDVDMRAQLDDGFQRLEAPAFSGGMFARAEAAPLPPRQPAPRPVPVPRLTDARAAARLVPVPPKPAQARWSVQLGSFATQALARRQAAEAERTIDGGDVRIEKAVTREGTIWRVAMVGMTSAEAAAACSAEARRRARCIISRPASGQVASR